MSFKSAWRRFWFGASYVPSNYLYTTRLRASAPTVTPDEVAKLERKWSKPQPPVDWSELGVL